MRFRLVARGMLVSLGLVVTTACGGGTPRAATADLVAIHQPTPDPTLDAVVRALPRTLAGVVNPTPTPTAIPVPASPGKAATPTRAQPGHSQPAPAQPSATPRAQR